MAEAGIGVQLLEIERMERALARTPRLATRFFTDVERAYCAAAVRPAACYAGCLAARSAVYKALESSVGPGSTRWDVTLAFGPDGATGAVLAGRASELACARGVEEVAVSISYTDRVAVASAMALSRDVRPQPKADPADERARIARSFREVRSVLDDLERVQEEDMSAYAGASPETGLEVLHETDSVH